MTAFGRYLCTGVMAVTATLLTVAAPALAEPASIEVSTAGIDTTSPAGRAELAARVARAAKSVCAPDDIRNLKQASQVRRCTEVALASSEQQIAAIVTRAQSAAAAATTPTLLR